MSFRTTAELVQGIVELVEDTDDLDPFILTANELVTELCSDSGYTDSRLELIERWLAAHFYCILRPRQTWSAVGSIQDRFESKVDLGLNVTRYGQMALRLDTALNLATLENAVIDAKAKVVLGITYLGGDAEDE